MAIIASDSGGGNFKPAPEGTHFGVCDMVVDLGNQRTSYMGADKIKRQIYLRWQVPAERVEWQDADGNDHEGPMVIGKVYTLSLHEKAGLRKDLERWRGRGFTPEELKGFDVSKLLRVPATIMVTHKSSDDRTYANVSAVAGLPKDMPPPNMEGDGVLYDDDYQGQFEKLPKWLKEKIGGRVAEGEAKADSSDPDAWRADMADDDVPF